MVALASSSSFFICPNELVLLAQSTSVWVREREREREWREGGFSLHLDVNVFLVRILEVFKHTQPSLAVA